MNISPKPKQTPILIFLLIANLFTWLGWLPALIFSAQSAQPLPLFANFSQWSASGFSTPQRTFQTLAFSLAVFGPLLAGLLATYLDTGRAGLAALGQRMLKWRVGARWYLAILAIAVCLAVIPVGLGLLTGLVRLDAAVLLGFLPVVPLYFVMQILTSGLGEEPGWRGFLLPRLQALFSGEKPIWILGLVWAAWHYPLTFYYTLPQLAGAPLIAAVLTVLSALAGQTMSTVGMTFVYVWVNNRTASVLLAILFHALANTLTAIPFGATQPVVGLLVALMPWAVVLVLGKVLPSGEFPGLPEHPG